MHEVSCKCRSGCSKRRCPCFKSETACNQHCKCKGCENIMSASGWREKSTLESDTSCKEERDTSGTAESDNCCTEENDSSGSAESDSSCMEESDTFVSPESDSSCMEESATSGTAESDGSGEVDDLVAMEVEKILKQLNVKYGGYIVPPTYYTTNATDKIPRSSEFENSHVAVGKKLWECLNSYIRDQGDKFERVSIYIMIPNLLSLERQTVKRLESYGLRNRNTSVFLAQSSALFDEIVDQMELALKDPTHLVVVIQDECHWGLVKEGQVSKVLQNAAFLKSPNFFVVHVSATADNVRVLFEKSAEARAQVVKWGDCGDHDELYGTGPCRYRGLEWYKENSSYVPEVSLPFVDVVPKNVVSKADKTDYALAYEYGAALLYHAKPDHSFPESLNDVESMVTAGFALSSVRSALFEKKMIVIRFFKIDNAQIFAGVVRAIVKFTGVLLDVHVDAGKECIDRFHLDSKKAHILLVVDRLRMGDTLPNGFAFFDLRSRYNDRRVLAWSTFLQDCGRAFGWRNAGQSPVMALGEFGRRVFFGDAKVKPDLYLVEELLFDGEDKDDVGYEQQLDEFVTARHMFQSLRSGVRGKSGSEKDVVKLSDADVSALLRRRLVLVAVPQVGKTGAYMYLVKKIQEYYPAVEDPETVKLIHLWKRMRHQDLLKFVDREKFDAYHTKLETLPHHKEHHRQMVAAIMEIKPSSAAIVVDFGAGTDPIYELLCRRLVFKRFYSIDLHAPPGWKNKQDHVWIADDMGSAHLLTSSELAVCCGTADLVVMCNSLYDECGYADHFINASICLKIGGHLLVSGPTTTLLSLDWTKNLMLESLGLKMKDDKVYVEGRGCSSKFRLLKYKKLSSGTKSLLEKLKKETSGKYRLQVFNGK